MRERQAGALVIAVNRGLEEIPVIDLRLLEMVALETKQHRIAGRIAPQRLDQVQQARAVGAGKQRAMKLDVKLAIADEVGDAISRRADFTDDLPLLGGQRRNRRP